MGRHGRKCTVHVSYIYHAICAFTVKSCEFDGDPMTRCTLYNYMQSILPITGNKSLVIPGKTQQKNCPP